jgi:hypothetical protein
MGLLIFAGDFRPTIQPTSLRVASQRQLRSSLNQQCQLGVISVTRDGAVPDTVNDFVHDQQAHEALVGVLGFAKAIPDLDFPLGGLEYAMPTGKPSP